jgi:hypothetical protein
MIPPLLPPLPDVDPVPVTLPGVVPELEPLEPEELVLAKSELPLFSDVAQLTRAAMPEETPAKTRKLR